MNNVIYSHDILDNTQLEMERLELNDELIPEHLYRKIDLLMQWNTVLIYKDAAMRAHKEEV